MRCTSRDLHDDVHHGRGRFKDVFRSAVIEALGDYKAAYARSLIAIASQDGPLLDDAILALGKIGDSKTLETLAVVGRSGSPAVQPIVHAAACLHAPDSVRVPIALPIATLALRHTSIACSPKVSTCSRKTSQRNVSSRSRARHTGVRLQPRRRGR